MVRVDPTTAREIRLPAAARASGVLGTRRSRSTTTTPSCTRMPMPIPSPPSVGGWPECRAGRGPARVPAIAIAALPITSITGRIRRMPMSSTMVTARKAMAPRITRSWSCFVSSTLSSDSSRMVTPWGR